MTNVLLKNLLFLITFTNIFVAAQEFFKEAKKDDSFDDFFKEIWKVLEDKVKNEIRSTVKDIAEEPKDGADFEADLKKYLRKKGADRILVKRRLPHSLDASKLVYDVKHNSLYRPLVKIHKKTKLDEGLNTENNKLTVIPLVQGLKTTNEALQKEELNRYYKTKYDDARNRLKLLRKLIERVVEKDAEDSVPILRDTSVQADDEFAPGKSTKPKQWEDEKREFWKPHISPWNFWTYHKTIYQDNCPRNQVELDGVCMWLPPHRRAYTVAGIPSHSGEEILS